MQCATNERGTGGLHNVKHVTAQIMGRFRHCVCRGLPKRLALAKPWASDTLITVPKQKYPVVYTGKESADMPKNQNHTVIDTIARPENGMCAHTMVKDI